MIVGASTSADAAAAARPRAAAWAVPFAVVVVLALVASLSGLHNRFAYDDIPIVRDNARVHELRDLWHLFREAYWPPFPGDAGRSAGLYRPLAMLAFALQWHLGHGAPLLFHAVSIALYAATAAAVLWLARELLPPRAALVAGALFAVHPVHVEAVANVVGQAELLAALACVLGVAAYVRGRRAAAAAGGTLRWRTALAVAGLYVVACFSKEHGVLLLPLLLLAEWLLAPRAREGGGEAAAPPRRRALAPHFALFAAVTAIYLAMRGSIPAVVAGQAGTAILEHYPWSVRFYTFLGVVPEWFRLLLWPARLAADYSPQEVLIPLRWVWSMAGGLVVSIGVLFLAALLARRDRAAAFAIGWTLVTLSIASGLVVATGVLLAERTLFLPSVGVALLAGIAAEWAFGTRVTAVSTLRRSRLAAAGTTLTVALLVVAGAWRSARRQPVWRDNATLFAQGVVDAPLSYRAHYSYGGELFETGRYAEGERQIRLAMRLFPDDPDPPDYLASRYMIGGLCEPAIPLLRQALAITPGRKLTRLRLISCLLATDRVDSAQRLAHETRDVVGADSLVVRMVFVADSAAALRLPPRP